MNEKEKPFRIVTVPLKRKFWTWRQIVHDILINVGAACALIANYWLALEAQALADRYGPWSFVMAEFFGFIVILLTLVVVMIDLERLFSLEFFPNHPKPVENEREYEAQP